MAEKYGTECWMIKNPFLSHFSHWRSDKWWNMVRMTTKWERKNSWAFALLQKKFIPPSFKSLTIIPGWEKYHSSIISFILRSFNIWMTIEWQNNHFTLTQNDRDGQGMRVIKIFAIKIFSPSNSFPCHSIILSSFWNHFS